VPGVWTQGVLKYCLLQQTSNEPLYRKAVLGLVARGYTFTTVDAETLVESLKSTELGVQSVYKLVLRTLANEHIRQEYAISVVVNFLYQLYLDIAITYSQLIDPRDELVFELLKSMTLKRSATSFIYNLKQAIHKRFQLIPLQKKQVLTTINAWEASQLIIT
jgi:hypothetical protein